MPLENIVVQRAREHNLKDVSVTIPRNKLVVITGVSGSGKSSLAFDTIYAEGQRRYVESLSAYARQFLGRMDKPDVEYIEGLSPAISGMLIVFMGLLLISGFIGLLPKALARLQKPPEPRPAPRPMTPEVDGLDPATLTAIALVLHAEAERSASQGMKVTLPLTTSPWALSSQMRILPSRIHS